MRKRIVSTLLAMVMFLSLLACANGADQTSTTKNKGPAEIKTTTIPTTESVMVAPNSEVARAIQYGFVPAELQADYDERITFQEDCDILRAMLERFDSETLTKWDTFAEKAATSMRSMKRDDGMIAAYYAACLMGIGENINSEWLALNEKIGEKCWDELSWDYPEFPMATEISPMQDNPGHTPGWDYITSSYFFALGQVSNVSNRSIFDYDLAENSMHSNLPLTREDAMKAAVRVYESVPGFRLDVAHEPDELDQAFLDQAGARRDSIVNSQTEIVQGSVNEQGKTYSGKAYYVSNSGNDANDGLAPERAWATLDRVNKENFAKGSAVFFERGGTWFGTLNARAQVTYSAYGTGTKPIFNGTMDVSVKDSANWTLEWEGARGEKVWVFQQMLPQAGGLFFDGGKRYAERLLLSWDSANNRYVTDHGMQFDPKVHLTHDLMFFSAPEMTGYRENDYLPNGKFTGPLYLRCDQGNPADAFASIEISLEGNGAEVFGNQVTLDNLSFRHYAGCGIICNGDQFEGTLIQNCEIAYCGGFVSAHYRQQEYEYWQPTVTGGAIHICGQNQSAINNYIHDNDCKCFIIVYQVDDSTKNDNILMRGNMIENSCTALYIGNFADYAKTDNPYVFRNITFTDNYVLDTGNCWGFEKQTKILGTSGNLCAVDLGSTNNANENFQISDNTFYLGKVGFVYGHMSPDNMPKFTDNKFVAAEYTLMAIWQGIRIPIYSDAIAAENFIRDVLGDQSATLRTAN